MSQSFQTLDHISTSAVERNRVLRNTYWLLALSMVPLSIAWLALTIWLGSTYKAREQSPS